MILKSIELKNFACYLEENFEFSLGLNIVSADNGGGKSELFNAFYWTFFNQVYDRGEGFTRIADQDLIPDYYKNSELNEPIICSATILLDAPNPFGSRLDNIEYPFVFKREFTFKRDKNGYVITIPSKLTISFVDLNGETNYIPDFQVEKLIDSLFPPKIRKFMWYIGETMKDLIDFENGETLNYALNEISYFPIFQKLNEITLLSEKSITSKIQKIAKDSKLISDEQKSKLEDKKLNEDIIANKTPKLEAEKKKRKEAEELIKETTEKLDGIEQFINYKNKLIEIDSSIESTKNDIILIEKECKKDLVTEWLVNGCEELIKTSGPKLELILKDIQKIENTDNPIPTNLPGSDYVNKMIDDMVCYICERKVEKDSDAYLALKKRVGDIEQNKKDRILKENYTELNKIRTNLLKSIPLINSEIKSSYKKKDALIKKRNELASRRSKLFIELNISEEQRDTIITGVHRPYFL